MITIISKTLQLEFSSILIALIRKLPSPISSSDFVGKQENPVTAVLHSLNEIIVVLN